MQKYFVLFVLILLFACGKQKNETSRYSKEEVAALRLDSTKVLNIKSDSLIRIDMNPFLKKQNFDFGSMVKEVKLIPLETSDESLIDDIYKVLVSDSNIYIMDDFKGRGIVIFDRNGKFVGRIPSGQGPGELVRLYDIAFDSENNELIAYQHSFLLFFTPAGKFIRQVKLPFGFYNFTVIPDGYIFKTLDRQGNEHLDNLADYTLLVTDKNFRISSIAMPLYPRGKVLVEYDYLSNNNDYVSVTQLYNDTVFQYSNKELAAKYVLNYGKKKLPGRYLHCNSFDEFDKAIRGNDYYFFNGRYQETKTHNVFFLENYSIGRTVIYRDKKTGHLSGGTNADYNMNEIPPIAFPVSSTDEYFISYYMPYDPYNHNEVLAHSSVISDEDKKKIKDLKEDDNPVLVFFKLDNF